MLTFWSLDNVDMLFDLKFCLQKKIHECSSLPTTACMWTSQTLPSGGANKALIKDQTLASDSVSEVFDPRRSCIENVQKQQHCSISSEAPGFEGTALGRVGPTSVCCDRVVKQNMIPLLKPALHHTGRHSLAQFLQAGGGVKSQQFDAFQGGIEIARFTSRQRKTIGVYSQPR